MRIYNPRGDVRLAQAEPDAYPREIWLSRRKLSERYGKKAFPLPAPGRGIGG